VTFFVRFLWCFSKGEKNTIHASVNSFVLVTYLAAIPMLSGDLCICIDFEADYIIVFKQNASTVVQEHPFVIWKLGRLAPDTMNLQYGI